MGKSQRAKGARFERELVNYLRDFGGPAVPRRNLQSQGGEAVGNDVLWGCFGIEAKVGKLPNPRAALAQAERDACEGRVPVAVIKDDRCEPFVVMRWDEWVEMARVLNGGDAPAWAKEDK